MKGKHKNWLIVGGIFIAITVVICLIFIKPADSESERISVSNTAGASFEFADDTGYKLITSEISSLYTFDSLSLEPSDEEFSGDWIYRIIFNPKSIMPNGNEIVVLFGKNNLSINGQTYVGADGVDYADILEWAAAKYTFFDYELLQ